MHLCHLCHLPGKHLQRWKERKTFRGHIQVIHLLRTLEWMSEHADAQGLQAAIRISSMIWLTIIVSLYIYDGVPLLTIAAAVSCTAHGVPCATLPALTAGQAGASGIVAEFITSAVFIIRANTWLMWFDKNKSSVSLNYWDTYLRNLHSRNFCGGAQNWLLRTEITCKVSAGNLCPTLPEGEVRGLGLTVSEPLLPEAPGKFLIALEFIRTVPV